MPEPVEILLVEDNPHDLEMILRSLRKNRSANRVRVAQDGEEADLVASYDLGVNSDRVKPVELEKCNRVIEQLSFYRLLLNEAPG